MRADTFDNRNARALATLARKIAVRVKCARMRQGLSMLALARRVGVFCSTIQRIEQGNLCSNISLLSRLARELGMTLDELCGARVRCKKSSKT